MAVLLRHSADGEAEADPATAGPGTFATSADGPATAGDEPAADRRSAGSGHGAAGPRPGRAGPAPQPRSRARGLAARAHRDPEPRRIDRAQGRAHRRPVARQVP